MVFNDNFLIALYLVAALGAFLIGFKLLSENLQKVANKGLRTVSYTHLTLPTNDSV